MQSQAEGFAFDNALNTAILGKKGRSVKAVRALLDVDALKGSKDRSTDIDKALEEAAWECFLEAAPKKNDINDITYIPVNDQTLARKNGDLMILYDLLPEIALQVYDRIHNSEPKDN